MTNGYSLITGASEGIGRVFATRLAEQGQNLIIVARNRERLDALANDLAVRHHVQVQVIVQDLGLPDAAKTVLDGCSSFPVARLINNAGFEVPLGPFQSSEAQAITAMLQVNVIALTELTRLFLPQIIDHGGSIINVASHAAFQPVPYMSAYAASKSFVLHFSEALHAELAVTHPGRVQVLALCPGATETKFWERSGSQVESTRFSVMQPQQVVDAALKALEHRQRSVVIPGFSLKVLTQLLRLGPRTLNTFLARKMVGY